MKKIEADTLENALIKASSDFNCSIIDLEYEIIQHQSSGFLGFGKKNAIICARVKDSSNREIINKNNEDIEEAKIIERNLEEISRQVKVELEELLSYLPYNISDIVVEPYDNNTLYVKMDGEDSALLIGKEGYRYKAISYMIFNWINHKYDLMLRLEIAEFLKNQEEMIANYLLPTIETVKTNGKAQTKPLDGVLAYIALKQLREEFPNKYVSFRLNNNGERYIIINDFHNQ